MRLIHRYIYFLLLSFLPLILPAQAIDNTVSFRNINSDHYTRIYYENDFFTGTDRDYTQGIYIEIVKPAFRRFPLSSLLWHPRNSEVKYGIALEDDGYTPNIIDAAAIQYGDRPYAGVLFLKTFLTATDADRHEYISTQLSTGIIGQSAGGAPMQKAIHHWIHYTQPLGWPNQIRNDVVLNYQLNYEREIFALDNNLSLATYNSLRLGTLSTKVSAGLHAMVGNFNSTFAPKTRSRAKKLQYYIYDEPSVNAVGYDATLQGGLFNHSSPYTIRSNEINRFTFQHKFGVALIFKKLYLEYFQTGLTPEFSTSVYHRTGGLQVGFGF